MKTKKICDDPPWPTTNKPGDTWGAYILHADGWWRLNPKWRKARKVK